MRFVLATVLAAIALGGCGSNDSKPISTGSSASPTAPATTATTAATTGGCRNVAVPPAHSAYHLKAPSYKLDAAKTYTVHVTTNCGSFAFKLNVAGAPKTAASFYALVKRGYFDDLTFHRIVPGFVIQGGDPVGDGSGGPGYTTVDPPPANFKYATGDVAMAKTNVQPSGTSGSQFFVVLSAAGAAELTQMPVYADLGKVVSGMSVVQRIGALQTNAEQYPTPPVVMSKVTVSVS